LANPAQHHAARILTPLTAEFWSPDQEERYRQSAFEEAARKIRLALLIGGGFYFALILIDLLAVDFGRLLLYCLIVRTITVAIFFFDYVMIRRAGTPKAQDFFTTLSALTIGLSEAALIIIKSESILHHGITVIVATLAFYLFIPHRFGNMLVGCITISLLFLSTTMAVLPPDPVAFVLTALLICCINLFGAFNQHQQNTIDRQRFLNLENLKQEIEEKTQAEEKLREHETYLAELFRTAPAPLLLVNINDGRLKMGNKAIADLLGVPHKHLESFNAEDFGITQKMRLDLMKRFKGLGSNEAVDLSIRNLYKDPIEAAFRATLLNFQGEECILINATDVTERRKRTDILRTIAEGFAGKTGLSFLDAMTAFLHETTGCEWALVGQLSDDGANVKSLSFNDNGTPAPSITYDLKGAPCERVVGQEVCIYQNGVAHLFPEDIALTNRGAEGYAGAPLFDSQGNPLGLVVIFGTKPLKDTETVSYLLKILAGRAGIELEAIQAEEQLQRSQEQLSVALEAAAEFMYTWDIVTDALQISAHDKSRFKMAHPPTSGTEWISRVHPNDQEKVRTAFVDHIRGTAASVDCEYRMIDDLDETYYLRVHAQAVRNDEGRATWIAGAVVDMTDDHRTRRALEESEENYRELVESSPDAIVVHRQEEIVFANQAAAKLLDISSPKEVIGKQILSFVNPTYRKIIEKRLGMLSEGHRRLPNMEFQIQQKSGALVDVDVVSQHIVRDGQEMVQSVIRNVAARKRADERLRQSEEHHKALFNSAPVGIFILSKDEKFDQINENLAEMLGYEGPEGRAELLSLSPVDVTHADDKAKSKKRIEGLFAGDIASYRVEKRWLHKDGSTCWGDISVTAIHDDKGDVDKAMVVVQDVTERKKMEEELRRFATTDSLTGASNRRHFLDRGEEELHRAKRYQRPLALLALDLDFFKTINDTYGHNAGDAALVHFAKFCTNVIREEDLFGRIGGEEFAIVMPESSIEGAKEAAERLRLSLEETPIEVDGAQIVLSVSIGIAGCPNEHENCMAIGDGFQTLLAQADKALYAAKENGRNRIEIYNPKPSSSSKKKSA